MYESPLELYTGKIIFRRDAQFGRLYGKKNRI